MLLYESVGAAQPGPVDIGPISVAEPPILVEEDLKSLQLRKDSDVSILMIMSVKFGDREV